MKARDTSTRRAPVVVALGGNAISPAGEADTIPRQFRQTARTAEVLADLLVNGSPVVITHGNGPQIGWALRRIELSAHEVYRLPLDICVADLQGGMGYMIGQCINNELRRRGMDKRVSTVVTSVEVDPSDPAFETPTKPIGPVYHAGRIDELRARGWQLAEVPNKGIRRVVPSPVPQAIVEIDLIRDLVGGGHPLIVAGGGGVPVARDADGLLSGREAVIDKDLATALLAREIGAEILVLATEIEAVFLSFGKPDQRPLTALSVAEAQAHLDAGEFPPGSMGPKMLAAIEFLGGSRCSRARVIICALDHLAEALAGRSGTTITRD